MSINLVDDAFDDEGMPESPQILLADLDEQALLSEILEQTGGSLRVPQQKMIEEIARAVSEGKNLVVQAGTGVGKSLGYLIPVGLAALQTGTTAVIATATLALQRQILRKDAPQVADSIYSLTGRHLKVAPLKGWSNYLCWHRLENGVSILDFQDELFETAAGSSTSPEVFAPSGETYSIALSATSSSPSASASSAASVSSATSSLSNTSVSSTASVSLAASSVRSSSLPFGGAGSSRSCPVVSEETLMRLRDWARKTSTGDRDDVDFPVDDYTWRTVSVTTKECLSSACAFAAQCFAKQAKEVVNSADIVVTNQALLSIQVAGRQEVLPEHTLVVVDEAHQLVQNVRHQATQMLTSQMVGRAARVLNRVTREYTDEFEEALTALEAALASLPIGLVRERPESLLAAVSLLDSAIRGAQNYLSEQSGQINREELQLVRAQLDDLGDCVNAWNRDPDEMITWVEQLEQTGVKALYLAPLNVPGILSTGLFDRQPTVLTSATLKPGGNFQAFRAQTGLELSSREWTEIDVGTPFDFARQGLLYVAQDLPIPGRIGLTKDVLLRVLELTQASGGGMLGLFTSYEAMRRSAVLLRERTDFKVLMQGDDSLPALLREFAEDQDSCLLGTRSLWEGVDVPGKACRLVVVDRIPFVRPDDPIALALQENAAKRKRSGFVEVSLTPAAVSLAQAVGRLIRANTDLGVVAILDPRLVVKNYGAYLVRSLPEMRKTIDLGTVIAALQRLVQLEF